MYYQDAVYDELLSLNNMPNLTNGFEGLKVYTDFDPNAQKYLENAIDNNILPEPMVYLIPLTLDSTKYSYKAKRFKQEFITKQKGYYDNIIFPISASVKQIELSLGATSQYDKYLLSDKCIYWSFDLANYRKSKWYFSSANCELSNQFTVRKISTVEKLLGKVK